MNVALLFAGQGSQRPGMLRTLPAEVLAGATYAEAREVLGTLERVPDELDSAEALRSSANAQLALLVAGVASARSLIDDHGVRVDAVAGHSIGAFAAAVVAGVLTLSDALRVVKVRGDEMERACADGSWGMAAVRGLRLVATQALVASLGTDAGPLWIACVNSADEVVVSGTSASLVALRRNAPAAGARDVTVLDVTVASHCPVQAPTAVAVADALAAVPHGEQRLPYFANVTGRRFLGAADRVVDDLAQAVCQPVRWWDAIRLMPELGVTATLQLPPGRVLTAITDREAPELTNVAVDDVGFVAAARRVAPRSRSVWNS